MRTDSLTKTASFIAALLLAIVCIRFSSAYFTYAAVIFCLFLVYDWLQSKKQGRPLWPQLSVDCRRVLLCTVAFYAVIIAESFILQDPLSVAKGFDLASLSLPLFMFAYLRGRYEIGDGIKWGLFLAIFIVCAYGLLREYWLFPGERFKSFFAHGPHFGTAVCMWMPLCAYYLKKEKSTWMRIGWAVLMAVQAYCVYLTSSRGAIAAFIGACLLTCGIMIWMRRGQWNKKIIRSAVIGVVMVLCIGGAAVWQLQAIRGERAKIGGDRIQMIEASYEMWKDHKVWGVGLARWQETYYSPEYFPPDALEYGLDMPHNMPVHFFSTAGTVGGAAYLLFSAAMLAGLYRTAKHTDDDWLSAAILTGFLAFFLQGLVDTTIINKIPARIFYALMGCYLAIGPTEKKQSIR